MSGSNYAANAFSGAGMGAAAGSAAGPYGALAGAAVGLIGGLFNAAAQEEDQERREEILKKAQKELDVSYDKIKEAFDGFYKDYNLAAMYGLGSYDASGNFVPDQKAFKNLADKVNSWTPDDRLKQFGLMDEDGNFVDQRFKWGGKEGQRVVDFVNPYAANVINASNRAVQHSAAGAGLGRSTGAAQAIAENTTKEYNDIYKTALDAYQDERNQAYREWSDFVNRQNDLLGTMLESDKYGIDLSKGILSDVLSQQGEQVTNNANLESQRAQTKAQLTLGTI